MTNFTICLEAILTCCVTYHALRAPVTIEVTDAEGRSQSARYYEDRDPELIEGQGPLAMQPPLSVFAHDEVGRSAGFTIDRLGIRPHTGHC